MHQAPMYVCMIRMYVYIYREREHILSREHILLTHSCMSPVRHKHTHRERREQESRKSARARARARGREEEKESNRGSQLNLNPKP
jgi:hypothetical protein